MYPAAYAVIPVVILIMDGGEAGRALGPPHGGLRSELPKWGGLRDRDREKTMARVVMEASIDVGVGVGAGRQGHPGRRWPSGQVGALVTMSSPAACGKRRLCDGFPSGTRRSVVVPYIPGLSTWPSRSRWAWWMVST